MLINNPESTRVDALHLSPGNAKHLRPEEAPATDQTTFPDLQGNAVFHEKQG